MQYTTKNIDRTPIGPYTGRRIAGTSNDVWDVMLVTQYDFGTFTVTVSDIPAYWDREQDRILLSGKIGTTLNRTVLGMAEEIMQHRGETRQPGMGQILRDAPINFVIRNPNVLPHAA